MKWHKISEDGYPEHGKPVVVYAGQSEFSYEVFVTSVFDDDVYSPFLKEHPEWRWRSYGWGGYESEMELDRSDISHWAYLEPPE